MKKNSLIQLKNTNIQDGFWNKYIRLVTDTVIPYQWEILNDRIPDAEPSHCIKNFLIASGEMKGEFNGMPFQDSDVAKWLEAAAYSLSYQKNDDLEKTVDEVIDLIGRAQCPDGYINTYFTIKHPDKRWSNLKEGHELYTAGHLIEAAVAYFQVTGKDSFLKIMMRFADLICDNFSDQKNSKGYPGHQEIELALIKLYEVTGIRKYLEQAKSFIERRGKEPNYFLEEEKSPGYIRIFPDLTNYLPLYSQSHLPVRKQKTAEGHAVRATYMYCAIADLAAAYDDEELLASCVTLWNNIVQKRMYITGSIGSSDLLERFTTDYDLPNDSNYSETCASIGLALFGRRMAQITGDAKYIDVVEKALYNTILSGIALDGKSFFYVNPLEVWPDSCLERTSREHIKPVRQKWFGVACCPPNIARTLASLGEYVYFTDNSSVFINFFIGSSTRTEINGKELKIHLETNFPNSGIVKIRIDCEEQVDATIAIRIPGYAKNVVISLDGKQLNDYRIEKGYARIDGGFHHNMVDLLFEMPVRFIRSNPKVRADSGKVAIEKGPLIYCLEEIDNGKNLSSIFVDTTEPLTESFNPDVFGGTTVIQAVGQRIVESEWNQERLYDESPVKFTDIVLTAVPYCYWGNRKPGEMLVWIKEFL